MVFNTQIQQFTLFSFFIQGQVGKEMDLIYFFLPALEHFLQIFLSRVSVDKTLSLTSCWGFTSLFYLIGGGWGNTPWTWTLWLIPHSVSSPPMLFFAFLLYYLVFSFKEHITHAHMYHMYYIIYHFNFNGHLCIRFMQTGICYTLWKNPVILTQC